MKDLKIAAVCMESRLFEIERNIERMWLFVDKACNEKVDIICFPEFSITGYVQRNPGEVYSNSFSEEIINRICGMAASRNITIIAGMIEISKGSKPFISQVIASPEGLAGVHRKTHLSPTEKGTFQEGEDINVFTLDKVTLGIQLCYEAHFPEISTLMALKGAEVIFFPHASPRGTPGEKLRSWLRHLPGRAFDNSLFVVACNLVNKTNGSLEFPGTALLLNPAGRIIATCSEEREDMLVAELKKEDLEEVRNHRMRHFFPNRRPELYKGISTTVEELS